MEFTLIYRGPLKANGSVADKQALRRAFHRQLSELWEQLPLKEAGKPAPRPVGLFRFVLFVLEDRNLIAQLDITMLRPEPPGAIITKGGDIDNRLKTLLDALRMPKSASEIPPGDAPGVGEDSFYCLLEDDALVTKVSVDTDRLLEPAQASEVSLLIHVHLKGTRVTYDNIGIIG